MRWLLFYRIVAPLANRLPRRVAYALARHAAGWAYRCRRDVREAATGNLRTVLAYRGDARDERELQRSVRRSFDLFAQYVVDFFRIGRLDPGTLSAMVNVEGMDHVEACLRMNRGIIGLTAHIGNWEIGAALLAARGIPVNAIVLRQPSAKLDALFQSWRARRGIRLLPVEGAAFSACTRLRRNEFVALLGDMDLSGQAPRELFFGKPARLPRGAAVLAARSGAPILPGFVLRQPDDSFLCRFEPPIVPGAVPSADDLQQRIRAVLERAIGDHPDQWFAFKPLWVP